MNMPNTQQNNEVENINKERNLLQDVLKINEKSLNQFQNGLRHIRVKKGKGRIFLKPKKYKI